jgi:hypothetical protein
LIWRKRKNYLFIIFEEAVVLAFRIVFDAVCSLPDFDIPLPPLSSPFDDFFGPFPLAVSIDGIIDGDGDGDDVVIDTGVVKGVPGGPQAHVFRNVARDCNNKHTSSDTNPERAIVSKPAQVTEASSIPANCSITISICPLGLLTTFGARQKLHGSFNVIGCCPLTATIPDVNVIGSIILVLVIIQITIMDRINTFGMMLMIVVGGLYFVIVIPVSDERI